MCGIEWISRKRECIRRVHVYVNKGGGFEPGRASSYILVYTENIYVRVRVLRKCMTVYCFALFYFNVCMLCFIYAIFNYVICFLYVSDVGQKLSRACVVLFCFTYRL